MNDNPAGLYLSKVNNRNRSKNARDLLTTKTPELSLSHLKVAILTNLGLRSSLAPDLFQFLLIHQVHMLLRIVFKLLN